MNGFVEILDRKISRIGSMDGYQYRDGIEIDGEQGILMPGMINLHTHLGMVPFRGMGDDCPDRLRKFLLPMEQRCMTKELAMASTRYAVCELLLSGVTTAFDMYYYENDTAQVFDEMGIRAVLGETVIEDSGFTYKDFDGLENFIQKWQNHPLITPCPAPHATNTCSAKTLQKCHQLSVKYQVPLTLHTAEMDYEMKYFREKFNQTPVEYLHSIGVLDHRTVAAHCIHMAEGDLELLKRTGASVAHCIGSNTKAAKGVAPVSQMQKKGIAVGLGTDGPASGNTLDILTQFKLFVNFHKNETRNRGAFPAMEAISLGTIQGARALHMEDLIGSIEVGKEADLVLLETKSVNMFPVYEPASAIVYSANSANVDTVFVAGKCLVKNKKLVNVSLAEVRTELEAAMKKVSFAEIAATL